MKNLFTILLLLISLQSYATVYHVKIGATGDTLTTIAQVNALSLFGNDSVLFNKGDVWRDELQLPNSGSTGSRIYFGSFGTGDNPQILGSEVTTWADQGSNIWKSADTFSSFGDAEIWFDESGDITWGDYKSGTGSFSNEYDWTYSGGYVYVYAASDPDSRYTSVEIPQRRQSVDTWHKEHIHWDGIDCFYTAYIGIDDNSSHSDHIDIEDFIIENCEIAYIGGITQSQVGFGIAMVYSDIIIRNCDIHDCGRRGISLDVYGSGFTAENALVEDCEFWNGFHTTAMDVSVGSGSYTGSWDTIIFRNNLISDTVAAPYGIGSNQIFLQNWQWSTQNAKIENVFIYNNVFRFPNNAGINMEGMNKVYVDHNTFYEGSAVIPYTMQLWIDANNTNIYARNNVFYSSNSDRNYGWPVFCLTTDSEVDLDYNLYYRINNSIVVVRYYSTDYYMNTITTTMRSARGWEENCPDPGDPLFTSTMDYTLQEGSPAIEAATPIAWITTDKDGAARDDTNPDCGAYEYDATPPVLVESIDIWGTGGATTIESDGGTLQMLKKTLPANANDTTVVWSKIDGTGSGTISATGLVTAVADGTMTARATANDGSGIYGDEVLTFSNQAAETTPTVTIVGISDGYTSIWAITGGDCTSDGGGTVSAKGVCWKTSSGPTTSDNKTTDGSGTGAFTSTMTGLQGSTTYYVKAYATNGEGTSYSNEVVFTTPKVTYLKGSGGKRLTSGIKGQKYIIISR